VSIAVFPNSSITPNSTHFCCRLKSLRAWWLVDKLNQVCLSRTTTKMCTVGGTGSLELGTTGIF
jgi:hypothetical protein